MQTTKLVPLCLLVFLLVSPTVQAQKCPTAKSFKKARMISEFSISIGGSHYFGDLNAYNQSDRRFTGELHKENMHPVIGFNYRFYPSKFINPRFGLMYTRLTGSDKHNDVSEMQDVAWFRQYRNLTFRTDVLELSAMVEINLMGFIPGDLKYRFSPYVLAGAGFIFFDPKAPYNPDWISMQSDEPFSPVSNASDYSYTQWTRLQPLGTEGQGMPGYADKYKLIQPNYTLGIGAKFNITSSVTMSWEVSHHFTFTDYLDDVSTVYPNVSDYYDYYSPSKAQMAANLSVRAKEMDPNGDYSYIVREDMQRGSPKFNDSYLVSTLTFGYKFTSKSKASQANPNKVQKQHDKKVEKEEQQELKNKQQHKNKKHQPRNEDYDYLNKRLERKKSEDLSKL